MKSIKTLNKKLTKELEKLQPEERLTYIKQYDEIMTTVFYSFKVKQYKLSEMLETLQKRNCTYKPKEPKECILREKWYTRNKPKPNVYFDNNDEKNKDRFQYESDYITEE